jgi:hypothetical protein
VALRPLGAPPLGISFIGDYLRDKCYRHLRPATPTIQSARMANGQVDAITEAYWISSKIGTTAIHGKFHHLPHMSSNIVLGLDILGRYPFTIDLEEGSASLRAPAAVDAVQPTPAHPALQVSENAPLTLFVGNDGTAPEDLLASEDAPGCAWYTKMRQEVEKNPAVYPDYCIQGDRLYRYTWDSADTAEPELSDPWKLCVTKPARAAVLRECHDNPTAGHLGIAKTTARHVPRGRPVRPELPVMPRVQDAAATTAGEYVPNTKPAAMGDSVTSVPR